LIVVTTWHFTVFEDRPLAFEGKSPQGRHCRIATPRASSTFNRAPMFPRILERASEAELMLANDAKYPNEGES
jgi:hypothetical protein